MTNDALAEFMRLVPPPPRPVGGPREWPTAERAIGTELPPDYKSLLDRYGRGLLCGFIAVWDPFPDVARWGNTVSTYLRADREARDNSPEEYGGKIFPEPGGRLPWASTENGDVMWWSTTGSPSEWTVIVWEPRGPNHQSFDMPVVPFLHAWVSGAVRVEVTTDYFIRQSGPIFEPR